MSLPPPIIGITMGDPAGIGPEIAVKAFAHRELHDQCRPLVIGDAAIIRYAAELTKSNRQIRSVDRIHDAIFRREAIDVFDLKNVALDCLQLGRVSATAGNAAFEAIRKGVDLALARQIDALVTGPISKESLNLAGHAFAGHTEILAHFTQASDHAMMLIADK